jgi:hypothetical protein
MVLFSVSNIAPTVLTQRVQVYRNSVLYIVGDFYRWLQEIDHKSQNELISFAFHVTVLYIDTYRGADKSLARPASRCILFDGENILFDASLVIYINSTNIPPIMIINRICEHQYLLSL